VESSEGMWFAGSPTNYHAPASVWQRTQQCLRLNVRVTGRSTTEWLHVYGHEGGLGAHSARSEICCAIRRNIELLAEFVQSRGRRYYEHLTPNTEFVAQPRSGCDPQPKVAVLSYLGESSGR
jgi:hypothetical protein